MKRSSQKLHIILIFIIEKAFWNQELQVTKVQNSSHASQIDVITRRGDARVFWESAQQKCCQR